MDNMSNMVVANRLNDYLGNLNLVSDVYFFQTYTAQSGILMARFAHIKENYWRSKYIHPGANNDITASDRDIYTNSMLLSYIEWFLGGGPSDSPQYGYFISSKTFDVPEELIRDNQAIRINGDIRFDYGKICHKNGSSELRWREYIHGEEDKITPIPVDEVQIFAELDKILKIPELKMTKSLDISLDIEKLAGV